MGALSLLCLFHSCTDYIADLISRIKPIFSLFTDFVRSIKAKINSIFSAFNDLIAPKEDILIGDIVANDSV